MTQEAQKRLPLDIWIDRLSKQEMPAFAHTARSLAYVSREEDSSANDLANVILHDTAMTARVLRLANSVLYNVSGHSIETVSYAIVILGFEEVRNLALTISMIDSVLNSTNQEKVQHEMVCAYHAAVQAKRLAERAGSDNLEAVYIGALLHRLGPIMFWCFPFSQAELLISRYASGASKTTAEKAVLGFTLSELTSALVSEWHLSTMLDDVLHGGGKHTDDQAVRRGLDIAEAAAHGWHSTEFGSELSTLSKQLGLSVSETRETIYAGAQQANDGLMSFGFPQIGGLLPPDETADVKNTEPVATGPDLEIAILRQLTHMLGEDMDINKVVMAVLEGVYRVLSMDTVMFAVVNHKTRNLEAKFMLGPKKEGTMSRKLLPGTGEYLDFLTLTSHAFWHSGQSPDYIGIPDPLIHSLGAREYFGQPIVLKGRVLGLVYADRQVRGGAFTAANLQSFAHLCDHVALAFKLLAR
jgi:HD-like signal output (HDOD) protein